MTQKYPMKIYITWAEDIRQMISNLLLATSCSRLAWPLSHICYSYRVQVPKWIKFTRISPMVNSFSPGRSHGTPESIYSMDYLGRKSEVDQLYYSDVLSCESSDYSLWRRPLILRWYPERFILTPLLFQSIKAELINPGASTHFPFYKSGPYVS